LLSNGAKAGNGYETNPSGSSICLHFAVGLGRSLSHGDGSIGCNGCEFVGGSFRIGKVT
jgi:hypothetical protein